MIAYTIIADLLTIIYLVIFIFYLVGWIKIPEFKTSEKVLNTKVCIVIPARNEEENIDVVLNSLLQQNYSKDFFEIIVVNDFSEDKTATVVKNYLQPNIRLIEMKNFIDDKFLSSKKKSIETAIENTDAELIITTDADCLMNENWLSTLVEFYETTNCKMIVAPVLINNEDGFVNKLLQLDLLGMAGITGATLQQRFPTMCNGANLAFTKKVFLDVNGYSGIEGVTSGDDMLLMHKIEKQFPQSVLFLKNINGLVYTKPSDSLPSFINQRMRWTSKSKSYNNWKIKANLLIVYLFNLSLLISFIGMFFNNDFQMVFAFQFIIKLIFDFTFLFQITMFYKRKKLLWLFLPAEIFHIFYIIIIGFAGNFFTTKWKGRKVTS